MEFAKIKYSIKQCGYMYKTLMWFLYNMKFKIFNFIWYAHFVGFFLLQANLFVVSAVHFSPYLMGLSTMMLIWAAGARCKWRAHLHNRMPRQRLEPQTLQHLSKHSTTELPCHPQNKLDAVCLYLLQFCKKVIQNLTGFFLTTPAQTYI